MPEFESRINLELIVNEFDKMRQEFAKVIVGQETMIDLLLTSLFSNGHILIEGVPGLAKTMSAKIFAKAIAADFSRIQFTPDLMPSDVIGSSIFDPKTTEFRFKKGPVFSNIILIDEINRSPAKTQSALFELMEERQVTIDGQRYIMKDPFCVIATQNPVEYEGTYRLPEAQLDRFLFKIVLNYPNEDAEFEIVKRANNYQLEHDISQVSAVLTAENLMRCRQLIKQVTVTDEIMRYISKLIHETRCNSDIFLGASPRASIALLNASKAYAVINGRDFVIPEDVQSLIIPCLNHRVIINSEREMEGLSSSSVLEQLIKKVEVPK